MKKITDADFSDIRVHELLSQAESQSIDWLSESRMRVLERAKTGGEISGLTLPWSKTHDKVRLRGGEVSLWAGYDGHGKSTIVNQVALHVAQQAPVGIASFEMPIEVTGVMLGCLAAGSPNPSMRWHNDFLTWTENRIAVFDRLDTVPPHIVFACVWHMANVMGCKFIVIDSLIMTGCGEDLEQQQKFMNTLIAVSKKFDIHIALVHHMRKPGGNEGESRKPSKFDMRGTGVISNVASTIFLIWADKSKKQMATRLEMGETLSPDEADHYENAPDLLLTVAKQRNAPFEGSIALWQHESRQFTPDSRRQPMPFSIPRLEGAA